MERSKTGGAPEGAQRAQLCEQEAQPVTWTVMTVTCLMTDLYPGCALCYPLFTLLRPLENRRRSSADQGKPSAAL